MLAASNSCGLNESRRALPSSWAATPGLSAEKTVRLPARTMEELQALAVIEGIEVDTEIEIHRQDGAHLPGRSGEQCPPEVGAAPQCFSGSPGPKLRSSRR